MTKTQTIVLNSVRESLPPVGSNVLLWLEIEENKLLDCGWVKAERVAELQVKPLIDFSQPGVIQDMVWISEGVAQEMHEGHLWSLPIIQSLEKPKECSIPALALR